MPVKTPSVSLYCQKVPILGVEKTNSFWLASPFRVYFSLNEDPLAKSVYKCILIFLSFCNVSVAPPSFSFVPLWISRKFTGLSWSFAYGM